MRDDDDNDDNDGDDDDNGDDHDHETIISTISYYLLTAQSLAYSRQTLLCLCNTVCCLFSTVTHDPSLDSLYLLEWKKKVKEIQ